MLKRMDGIGYRRRSGSRIFIIQASSTRDNSNLFSVRRNYIILQVDLQMHACDAFYRSTNPSHRLRQHVRLILRFITLTCCPPVSSLFVASPLQELCNVVFWVRGVPFLDCSFLRHLALRFWNQTWNTDHSQAFSPNFFLNSFTEVANQNNCGHPCSGIWHWGQWGARWLRHFFWPDSEKSSKF